MKKKLGARGGILTVAVLMSMCSLSVLNLKLIKVPLEKWSGREIGFAGFVEEVKRGYTSDRFRAKTYFLNLNGLFARLTGRRVLNDVVRCENGMLARTVGRCEVSELAEALSDFSTYLDECEDIPFLYVQIPCKENLDGLLPVGVTSYVQENTDDLLTALEKGGVETLDLRPKLTQTQAQVEKYYYSTDHHWNGDGAFVAFQELTEELGSMFPERNIDLKYTQPEQWERHMKEDWFLGSQGKRVGTLFGGTDPLVWYTPRFETEMSCAIPKHWQLFKGDFSEANIRLQYINEKNYFGYNAYCVYIGGDYPLVQHRNTQAPSDLKVLVMKDSYMLPLQAFLSVEFQEVDVIDPRYFSECTLAEYVEWTQPDVVIMAINPSVLGSEAYRQLGIEQMNAPQIEAKSYAIVEQHDIEVEANDSDYNYKTLHLEADSVYRVSFTEVNVLEGESCGVSVMLYNATTKKLDSSTIFDLEYCNMAGEYTWEFKTPQTEDELQLLFYAGIHGATAKSSVIYRNVLLEKQIEERPIY